MGAHKPIPPAPSAAAPLPRSVKSLLRWFSQNARPLPWRQTTDPYAIWVSEIMLQQTQVNTVIPYWERWMAELPTLAALAKAPEQKILKLWEGLGYYRRARNLQAAARFILEQYGGHFPQTLPELLALPGVGHYTTGAVLSIAFNQPAPVLDGNVQRVLCRFHGIHGLPTSPKIQKQLWSLSETWVRQAKTLEEQNPGKHVRACSALNQSLMELGATVCVPQRPHCNACPLQRDCHAFATGQTERLPLRKQRVSTIKRVTLAAVVVKGDRVLIRQRPENSVNGKLWEFPNQEFSRLQNVPPYQTKERLALSAWLRRDLGLSGLRLTPWRSFRHTITKNRFEVRVWSVALDKSPAKKNGARWATWAELGHLPMPAVHRRIAKTWPSLK